MADLFTLTILTPEKCFLDEAAEEVVFTTPEGRAGVMAGHMSMVAAVAEDTIEIRRDGQWKTAAVGQGVSEVFGDKVAFYVDSVEWADEIDIVRAQEALRRAEEHLKSELSRLEYIRTQTAMSRALARLKAADTISSSR